MSNYSNEQPYLFKDYADMRSNLSDRDIYNPSSPQRGESEFKKPYLANEYPESENLYTPPGGFRPNPPWVPPGPGGDCKPTGDAVGGGLDLCDSSQDCGQWVYHCAHKITSFTAVGGKIKSVRYQSNDTAVVTACWEKKKGKLTISGGLANGNSIDTSFDKEECCKETDGKPVISYTTQQMSLNETQNLSVSGGSGGPYNWAVTSAGSDSGTLSITVGDTATYTAPSSNADCLNNPTIYVTDKCGNVGVLEIAINAWTATAAAFWHTYFEGSGCSMIIRPSIGNCAGVDTPVGGGYFCATCCLLSGICRAKTHHYAACDVMDPTPCTEAALIAACKGMDFPYCNSLYCDPGFYDNRTSQEKAGGCCPWQLL